MLVKMPIHNGIFFTQKSKFSQVHCRKICAENESEIKITSYTDFHSTNCKVIGWVTAEIVLSHLDITGMLKNTHVNAIHDFSKRNNLHCKGNKSPLMSTSFDDSNYL